MVRPALYFCKNGLEKERIFRNGVHYVKCKWNFQIGEKYDTGDVKKIQLWGKRLKTKGKTNVEKAVENVDNFW